MFAADIQAPEGIIWIAGEAAAVAIAHATMAGDVPGGESAHEAVTDCRRRWVPQWEDAGKAIEEPCCPLQHSICLTHELSCVAAMMQNGRQNFRSSHRFAGRYSQHRCCYFNTFTSSHPES